MADWAGILALPVTVAGGLIQLLSWLRPARDITPMALDEQARLLAEAVLLTESRNLRRLIRGDHMAQVQFAANPAGSLTDESMLTRLRELLRYRNELGYDAGDISNISEYFQALPLPRMIVLGPPGAGKTILLISLIVQSLREFRNHKVVTMRVDLAGYDPFTTDLGSWLAQRAAIQYPIPATVARRLVESGRILPILDGLDEMDVNQNSPERGIATLKRVSSYVAGVEFGAVMACREVEWKRISSPSSLLSGFSVIYIQPLDPKQIRSYIDGRLNELPHASSAWLQILKRIERNSADPLFETLSRPLWLSLAVMVYGSDPRELLKFSDGADLRAQLLANFVSLATNSLPYHRSLGSPRYHEKNVLNWIRELASFLERAQPSGVEAVEIIPDRIWPIAGLRRVRLLHVLLASLMGALTLLFVWPNLMTFIRSTSPSLNGHPQGLITATAIAGILVTMRIIRNSSVISTPPMPVSSLRFRRIHIHMPPIRDFHAWLRRALGKSFVDGYRAKLVVSVLLILPSATSTFIGKSTFVNISTFLLASVFIYVTLSAVNFALEILAAPVHAIIRSAQLEPRRPYDALRRDRLYALFVALFMLTLTAVIDITPSPGSSRGPYALSIAALTGLLIVLISRASVRYALAVTVMAVNGRMPLRLKRFLNWSVDVGLLREAGPTYQFRHVELQRWLTDPLLVDQGLS
jgi:hypothetical protein